MYSQPPALSNTPPDPETTAPQAGAMNEASRGDHKHPRLTSSTAHVVGANNETTLVFTRSFSVIPAMDFCYVEAADNPPIVFKVKTWTMDGANYVGCVCKAYRATIMPSLSGIILIGPLISALSGLNIFGGSAVGVQFTCIALQSSQ